MEPDCKQNFKHKNSRINKLKVSIEKKRQCNSKALEVVTNLSENTVNEDSLVKNLQFINQEHYQDIVEERSINKLCGYPVCSSNLKNIPSKQYHISTIHNKVFDITDRKNFCSNLCYKASKYLKEQISTSPLWFRENNSSTAYKLISLQSKGGSAGDEVDFGITPIQADLDLIQPNNQTSFSADVPNQTIPHSAVTKESKSSTTQNITNTHCSTVIKTVEDRSNDARFTLTNSQNAFFDNADHTSLCTLEKVNDSKVEDEQPSLTECADSSLNNLNFCSESNIDLKDFVKKSDKISESNATRNTGTSPRLFNHVADATSISNEDRTSKINKGCSKVTRKKKEKKSHLTLFQSTVIKVEQILKEWFTLESLCFTFGEEKVKEIIAEKTTQIKELQSLTGKSMVDSHFYENYLAICKKLNILELVDTKADAPFREEVKKPLPEYGVLKKEAEEMELKVKMFFKGDKVQFEKPVECSESTESSTVQEPVLPLVHLHAQRAVRRRIVLDKLRRIIQDMQKSLGLREINFSESLRTLVSTLNLSAHNITMKPAEWNLVSIVLIKLLSLRDKGLEEKLKSSSSHKHLTLLLMSYSLDGGYLDRLISWLTDIDSLLQNK